MLLKGAFTALVTPFKENGQLDLEGFAHNIRFQIDNGIDGIVALGTTGEAPTLTDEEMAEVTRLAVREAKGKVPVLVGTGDYCTAKAIKKTNEAKRLGADAALIVTPYYNRPTQEGLYRHFKAITEAVDLPIAIYNVPSRTGCNLEVETLSRLVDIPRIIGLKECTSDMKQLYETIRISQHRPDFSVVSGNDSDTFIAMALGAHGVISVISNLIPSEMVSLIQAMNDGQYEEARKIHQRLWPLMVNAFIEPNPLPIKAAMSICGMPSGPCRLPLVELRPYNHDKLLSTLREMGLVDEAILRL